MPIFTKRPLHAPARLRGVVALAALAAMPALAQQPKTSTQAIEEYRAMLADGNPAELFEAKGEDLW